jgi:polysaccharide export outer membrane protein
MRLLRSLLVLCLVAGPAWAQTSPDTYGTFSTPGSTPPAGSRSVVPGTAPGSTSTGRSGQPGAVQETGTPQIRTPNGAGTRVSPLDMVEPASRRIEPPPRPSEFQKFVEAATGRLLPVFGASFFADTADARSPLDNVPVSADYVIGPGDELLIRAWGSIDVDYRATVDRNGQINLPKVGSFSVAGVRASEIERHLRTQIGRLFTNFNLNVTLGQLRGLKVFVVGPAQRPGVYTLASQSTMLSAVAAAGGPGANGSMRKVTLRRDGRVVSELDIYDFLVQGDKSRDVQLAAGDVVVFQPVGPRVALTGALETPGIYELRNAAEPLRDVLRYAGGAPVLASRNRGQLERIDPTQPKATRLVEQFKLDEAGLAKPMRDGDVVTLLEISPQFANAVTLRGHVAQPLRYPHTPGMRISDLIPDKDALISPDFYRRKNLLVQVLPPEEDADDPRRPASQADGRDAPGTRAEPRSGRDTRDTRDTRDSRESRDSRELVDRGDRASATANGQRATQENGDRTGPARLRQPTTLFDELNWEYAVIERLNEAELKTQVIPFNLGKAVIQRDPAHNVELRPGDVVTVYSQKDLRVPVSRQTRLVSVEGEVAAPGVYQLLPGETLKGLLDRAGGFTGQAYIYGLEFSREETRQRQRENLNAAMTRLQALSATQAARDAANRRDDLGDRTAAVSNAATQAQLARLAQLQPNGRIALELQPDMSTIAALPDVPLEHGDRIVVPSRPGFVTVAGAVVNNNAFLWKPGRTAGDYVRLAGLDEAADISNMFVLRADGTVTSSNDRRGFFSFGGVESQALQPGDAVVVPNQLDYETWGRALVRNLKDWSQIFSQFGLGAAAIQTLRNN